MEDSAFDHRETTPASLLEMVADEGICTAKWPRNLLQMVETLTSVWVRNGAAPDEAASRAREGVAVLAWSQGGRPVYLPVGKRMAEAVRNAAMFAEYTYRPDDIARLREKYAIPTERAVYAILAQQRAIKNAKRQAAKP